MTDRLTQPRPGRASALKRWLLLACLCVAALILGPSKALAVDDDEVERDGRIEGYTGSVSVENQSTALMWLLFVFLGVIGLIALFKDAKRTHLD
jgi:hypothetical protein